VHTLHVPSSQRNIPETWFAIRGANLNLGDKGNVEPVHAAAILEIYLAQCRQCRQGSHRQPGVIRVGNIRE